MIDWLSWPLAQHVDTWVIALLRGLAAVQKFTILIDVTLLKIELVSKAELYPLEEAGLKNNVTDLLIRLFVPVVL